jgi:hypothetical protein
MVNSFSFANSSIDENDSEVTRLFLRVKPSPILQSEAILLMSIMLILGRLGLTSVFSLKLSHTLCPTIVSPIQIMLHVKLLEARKLQALQILTSYVVWIDA